jgi:hypothetical protein
VDCLFVRSRGWWIISNASRASSIVAGVASVLVFPKFEASAIIIFLLYVLSELSSWRSDAFKRSAEAVLRKLDFRDSFGWEITHEEMSDLVVDCPSRLRRRVPPPTDDNYFASKQTVGVVKGLENLQESAWWTKHLVKRMGHLTLFLTIAVTLLSLLVLLVSIHALRGNEEALATVGRVVTSALMLILSLGLVRLTLAYYQFGKKADLIEREAGRLLKAGADELEAVKLWHDYQVSRATAPLIPSSLWRWMNKDLNEAWLAYRTGFGMKK